MKEKDFEILRLITAGSVDDGKSTLIGRLLYDSKAVFRDQLNAIEKSSQRKGLSHIDLSLLTDGLKDEREQGITIDVAYRYFTTQKRKFVLADSPGHVEYTRNMVTAASTANLAILLVDARKGVVEQTKRHAFIASLLEIPHLVICINKMDLVDYSEKVFQNIVNQFEEFSGKLSIKDIHYIPISALNGDMVVERGEKMTWYNGTTLLSLLETIHITSDRNVIDLRLPIQCVIRPHQEEFHDYRAYAGRVESGTIKKGNKIKILPQNTKTEILAIYDAEKELSEANASMSISVTLKDDVDCSRGNMIVNENNVPNISKNLDVMMCWLGNSPAKKGKKYLLMHTTNEVQATFESIVYRININTLEREESEVDEIGKNDLFRAKLITSRDIFWDSYKTNRKTGSFILVDASTNETVAAGMLR